MDLAFTFPVANTTLAVEFPGGHGHVPRLAAGMEPEYRPECGESREEAPATQGAPEPALYEAAANMWRGIEAVGGRLQITTRGLLFQPHAFHHQAVPTEIPFVRIESVTPCDTKGILPNGLCIRVTSGLEYRFVVWGRDRLIQMILSHAVN